MPIQVAGSLADRKITLVCHERPAGEVMFRVAEAMGLVWRPTTGHGWRAELDDEVKAAEFEAERYEEEARERRISGTLQMASKLQDLSPQQQVAERTKAYSRIKELERVRKSEDSADLIEARQNYSSLTSDPAQYSMLSAIARTYPEASKGLGLGNPLFVSSNSADHVATISELPETFRILNPPVSILGFVKLSSDGMSLFGKEYGVGKDRNVSVSHNLPMPSTGRPTPPKLSKWFRQWASVLDHKVLVIPLSEGRIKVQADEYVYVKGETPMTSVADQVFDLAIRANISVVADAYRLPSYGYASIRAATVDEWISKFNRRRIQSSIDFYPCFARALGGWVMFRHDRYWAKLPYEIPERLLKVDQSHPRLGIEEYADFAAQLSPEQLAATKRSELLPVNRAPLAEGGKWLLFWFLSIKKRCFFFCVFFTCALNSFWNKE